MATCPTRVPGEKRKKWRNSTGKKKLKRLKSNGGLKGDTARDAEREKRRRESEHVSKQTVDLETYRTAFVYSPTGEQFAGNQAAEMTTFQMFFGSEATHEGASANVSQHLLISIDHNHKWEL